MTPLESAIEKILQHARKRFAGGRFALALDPDELDALVEAYPNGFPVTVERKYPA